MADFDDMTGWRQEIHAWEASKEYRANAKAYYSAPIAVTKLSDLLHYIELRLRNKECLEADREIYNWQNAYEDLFSPEARRNKPNLALQTLSEFDRWFKYKKKLPNSPLAFLKADEVVVRIQKGVLSSARSKEAIELLGADGVKQFIDFEN